jgi:hypothetical protein
MCASAQPILAIELMTGDGYLLALTGDAATRDQAQGYAAGSLDALIVLNEVLSSEGPPLFCLTEERAAAMDGARLRDEFTNWLKLPTKNVSDQPIGGLPLSALAWGFLGNKFACAESSAAEVNGEARSLLMDSMRK